MKTLLRYLPLLILAIAWETASRLQLVSSLALPPLSEVAAAWWDLLKSGELVTNGAASLWRAGAGLFLSIVIGGALGIFMAWWRPVNIVLGPLVEALYLLPVTIGAYNGARGSDQALVWTARSMGASKLRMLWDVVLPSATPELLNGIRTALALSFILLVSSELIVAREGLGFLIGSLGSNGNYDAMYAVVLTVAFIGFAADRVYQIFQDRMLRWQQ
jgi:NitT/TauT family transport system permease protein